MLLKHRPIVGLRRSFAFTLRHWKIVHKIEGWQERARRIKPSGARPCRSLDFPRTDLWPLGASDEHGQHVEAGAGGHEELVLAGAAKGQVGDIRRKPDPPDQ